MPALPLITSLWPVNNLKLGGQVVMRRRCRRRVSIVPKPGRAIAQPNPPIIYAPNQILYKILQKKKPLQNTTVLLFLDKNIGITFFSLRSLKISKPPSDL